MPCHVAKNEKQLYPTNILDMFPVGYNHWLMVKQQEGIAQAPLSDRRAAAIMDCRGSK